MALRKHIAIISPINRQARRLHGGITPLVINLANGFQQRGVRTVVLMAVPVENAVHPSDLDPDIELVNLGRTTKPTLVFRLARHLKTARPDILLSAGWRFNLIAGWCKRFFQIDTDIWASIHNPLSAEQQRHFYLQRWKKRFVIALAYQRLEGIIAVSQGVAEDFCRKTGFEKNRVHVIHNPIVSSTLIAKGRENVVHRWYADDSPPVIIGLGRLEPQKDFTTLIRAFAILRRQIDCRLLILGEGRLRPELEALVDQLGIADSVELPGFVKNPFAFLRRSALFVLSSAWEGFGNVVVEALAMGVPVVSTDCPHGPREILDNGRYGSLVAVGDPDAMSLAMRKALESPADSDWLRGRAQEFEVGRIADRYLRTMQLIP